MKSLRIIGFIFSLAFVLASVVAPAEVQAMVPPSVHDFIFGDGTVALGMAGGTVSLTSFGRIPRQETNLGGIAKLILFGESDFTAGWPKKADIAAGVLATALPLKTGVVGAVVTFDIGTCRVKSDKKGDIGYQNVSVSGECKMAGYSADQITALEKTLNEGGVAIVVYKNGNRAVYGASYEPLTFEDSTDSGAKSDDKLQMDFKFKGDGYGFHPPLLDATVTIPLPA